MTEQRFFATAPKNMESLLADELRGLGLQDVAETRAGAGFSGTLEAAYRVCLWSRVANRILLRIAHFPADSPDALYQAVRAIPWEDHIGLQQRFAVDFSTSGSSITHSHFGALKVKDALVDRFREREGARPSVDTENPDLRINVYLLRDVATVSIDLSGDSLHRRGYRKEGAAAPLKENLAAAILLRAGWPALAAEGMALLDPMCGSGTLPVEAALIAGDCAPGLARTHWGFSGWKQHDGKAWNALLEEARERRVEGLKHLPAIRGYDQDPRVVRIGIANAERAGLHGLVHFEKKEIKDCLPVAADGTGLVVTNPPYGERMGAETGLPGLYASLGQVLKTRFSGWKAAVFTGNPELGKRLGLRAHHIHTLYNGRIECKLLHLSITPEWFVEDRSFPRPLPADERSEGAAMFANRLRKNLKHLSRWLKREGVHCYRLYDADLPEYALAIDIYDGERRWVHAQEYEAPRTIDKRKARLRLREALGVLLDELEIPEAQLFFKVRRPQKGREQYQAMAASGRYQQVVEGNNRFLVNLKDYLDTGLFLDQRITRELIASLAGGQHFLNLFAYTGTATVFAASGGALSTTTVDMSNNYLDWARRNMELNGYTWAGHRFIRTDCLSWLQANTEHRRYGLIFLDPPSFSSSKRMEGTFDVQRDHVDLIRKTLGLLEPGGTLIFSNNLRSFKLERERLSDWEIQDISRQTLPPDFKRNPKIHRCWRISYKQG
ncbi:MAG: bifunctional 23S rRNA (guanine(2069)-N(7))-methyltransferase RlmK/23S rRNA (guanine(2445)-N(2))-methyltransferase RlmL [Gammaproteobacteria bacterium]|nr:bifunctional 23S rRNA (guanine(2069)-N(7))-methyltransferase RlmK/23S rRNA (guanine(2445)-N(2))-methyltransferase RlmL [Gammaproteobacteria bacterium]